MTDKGICIVTHPLGSSGENATRTLLEILSVLQPVSLITANLPKNSKIREEYTVVELTPKDAGKTIFIAAIRFLYNQLKMCKALWHRPENIVIFFGATSYLLPIIFARILGKTVLVEPRGNVPLTLRLNWEQKIPNIFARVLSGFVGLLEKAGFAAAHRVVTYTPNMARDLGLDPNSPKVYPHGARFVDTQKFYPDIPIDQRKYTVGYLGRIDEEKGIRELASIVKQLPASVTVRFVGDGPMKKWLATELDEEISAGKVELAGWVSHNKVPNELNRIKILVMPSHPTEGLPTTILEALSCGTLVYANPVAGVRDVVKHGKTGFLMNNERNVGTADEILSILERDDLKTISENGRAVIEEKYSHDAAIKRYRALFEEL